MSEQVILKGKIQKFYRNENELIENYFKRFYKFKDVDFVKVEDNYDLLENFSDDFYEEAIYFKDEIYYVLDFEKFDNMDIFEARRCDDNTIDFVLSYYNSGCCFSEALESALKELK